MAIFYKTSEVAKEEARIAELRRLYDAGKINAGEYMDAINSLKQANEGRASTSASVLDVVQLGLLAAIVVGVIYGVKQFK